MNRYRTEYAAHAFELQSTAWMSNPKPPIDSIAIIVTHSYVVRNMTLTIYTGIALSDGRPTFLRNQLYPN